MTLHICWATQHF